MDFSILLDWHFWAALIFWVLFVGLFLGLNCAMWIDLYAREKHEPWSWPLIREWFGLPRGDGADSGDGND